MSAINGVKFPSLLYGCKGRVIPRDGRILGDVIADMVRDLVGQSACVWDAFCGSGYCGAAFRRRGLGIVSSDVRASPWLKATALGVTKQAILPDTVEALATATPGAKGWFTANETPLIGARNAAWLDALMGAFASLSEAERLAAAMGVICAVENIRSTGAGFLHFKRAWHGEALCDGFEMRDKDIAGEWRRFMIDDYPRLVHDNGRDNHCLLGDAAELAVGIKADAAYIDPPYTSLCSSYEGCYDLVDDWARLLLGDAVPPEPTGNPHRRFSSPEAAIASFATLMERSAHIPLWVISYSDSDTMRVLPEEIAVLAELEGRSVDILRFPFPRARMTKAPGQMWYNECLIVCRDAKAGKTISVPPAIEVVGNATDFTGQDSEATGEPKPTCASLFSGIGGTDLAVSLAGFRCVLACEKDGMARMAYEANFGHAPHPDVLGLDPALLLGCELLSAGWPCQDLSIGGRHKGMDGDRCRLALEIVRIAAKARPKAILLENANTLPTHDGGRLLEDLLARFAAIGYRGWWRILDACDFGMPTLRKRTYVVLFRDDLGVDGFEFPKPSGEESWLLDVLLPNPATRHLVIDRPDVTIEPSAVARAEAVREQYTMRVGWLREEYPPRQGARIYSPLGCSATICSGGGGLGANTGLYLVNGKVRPLHPREAARALGFPDSFLLPENEAQALRLLGNSVAVPVVARIAREIAGTLRGCGAAQAQKVAARAMGRNGDVLKEQGACRTRRAEQKGDMP